MTTSAFDGPLGPALLQVISGSPSAEELAAVTALLTALAVAAGSEAGDSPAVAPRQAGWGRPQVFPPLSWMAAGRAGGS
ncbi:acyl-CoA carboxylase subunit epsilon [Streptomyces sp. WAC 01529]|uniref:acyl-CoA carboxylase epsilon subunit n=1 Tax=Streptomyces sp. WAC 01529 TaxID=2203205 RepID=UPI000F719E2E|nr:acyl-CoA carboxylase epsilon subunit [Streptomyces sp. WAC 01529]AZM56526.1 acyl-CoA carboxylase subunit epsilon [Streptomyces sp. WAC 01529]